MELDGNCVCVCECSVKQPGMTIPVAASSLLNTVSESLHMAYSRIPPYLARI